MFQPLIFRGVGSYPWKASRPPFFKVGGDEFHRFWSSCEFLRCMLWAGLRGVLSKTASPRYASGFCPGRGTVSFLVLFFGGPRMETCDLKFWSRVWVRIPQDTRSILIQRDSWHSLRLWFAVSLPRLSTQRQIFLHVCAAKVFSSFWPFLDAPSCLLDPPPKILIVFWLGHVLLTGWDSRIDLFFFLRYGCPAPSKDKILIPGCAKILRSETLSAAAPLCFFSISRQSFDDSFFPSLR